MKESAANICRLYIEDITRKEINVNYNKNNILISCLRKKTKEQIFVIKHLSWT